MSRWFRMAVDGSVQALAAASLDERAFQYGDGLFETIAIRNAAPRLLPLHLERLATGCQRLGLDAPGESSLILAIQELIHRGDCGEGVLKIIVSAGPGQRGYRRGGSRSSVWLGLFERGAPGPPAGGDGVRVRICNTRLAIQPQLAGIKSLNRLEQVLARAEWDDDSVFEGLLLDTERRLVCGTMSNVFIVSDNTVVTPAITRCGVSGVMRRHLLAELHRADIETRVVDLGLDEALDADAMFLTNSQFGLLAVERCEDRRWAGHPLTARAAKLLAAAGIVECCR